MRRLTVGKNVRDDGGYKKVEIDDNSALLVAGTTLPAKARCFDGVDAAYGYVDAWGYGQVIASTSYTDVKYYASGTGYQSRGQSSPYITVYVDRPSIIFFSFSTIYKALYSCGNVYFKMQHTEKDSFVNAADRVTHWELGMYIPAADKWIGAFGKTCMFKVDPGSSGTKVKIRVQACADTTTNTLTLGSRDFNRIVIPLASVKNDTGRVNDV